MYRGPHPGDGPRVTWQSVTAGFVLNAAFLAILVALSHPVATGAVIATGVGLYAVRGALRRVTFERTVQLCRADVCVRFQLRVG